MRYLLLTLFVFALAAPALAAKTEDILQMSDDTIEGAFGLGNYSCVGWFVAPADCHVLSASFYVRYDGMNRVGVWDNDDSGPNDFPGTLFGSIQHFFDYGSSWTWSDYVYLTGLGITMAAGEKFWVGITESAGMYPFVGLDTTDPDYGVAYTHNGSPWDWESQYDAMIRVKINDDMDAPYADGQDPYDGELGVPVDSDIVFHVKDDDIGVDVTTIYTNSVVVTDDTKAVITGTVVPTGTPDDYTVTFTPDSDFAEGVEVTVTVSPSGNKITDDLDNEMAQDNWSFEVFLTGVESSSLGEIKANYTEPEGDGATAPGAETIK